jgi:hypothetical protein
MKQQQAESESRLRIYEKSNRKLFISGLLFFADMVIYESDLCCLIFLPEK